MYAIKLLRAYYDHSVRMLCCCVGLALSACGGGGDGYDGGGMTCSNGGVVSGSMCIPTGTITAPGSTVSGTVALSATASVEGTVSSVQFLVDGNAIGAPDTTSPYGVSWDTTTVSDGAHALTVRITDAQNRVGTSAASNVTVANTRSFNVTLGADQIYPVPVSTATASGTLVFNVSTGAVSGSVTLNGVTATAVTINNAFAGSTGAALLNLSSTATDVWSVDSGASISSSQIADLLLGKLYVLVQSAANPSGEIRGQVLPAGISILSANLSGAQEVPPVITTASGSAFITVNTVTKSAAVHVSTTNAATASGAQLLSGAAGSNGTTLAALVADNTTTEHWFNDSVTLQDADITAFNDGQLYVNVFTPANSGGEIRGQFAAPAAPAPTLTQLQASIFGPFCSGCHTGGGAGLPAAQNLSSAAATYTNTVNVASIEQPAVLRIKPGDPDNSYLVRKLQGTAGISGGRMPPSGALTQEQIDQVRAWVTAGALNN